MKTISIKELAQGGASRVVREAEQEPVLISRNNEPAAWVLGSSQLAHAAAQTGSDDLYRNALALLAAQLFDDAALTMGQAAKLAGMSLSDFIDLCSSLHIPILREPEGGLAEEVNAFHESIGSVRKKGTGEDVAPA